MDKEDRAWEAINQLRESSTLFAPLEGGTRWNRWTTPSKTCRTKPKKEDIDGYYGT